MIINLLFRKTPKPRQAFRPSIGSNSITALVELNLLVFLWEILFFIYFCFMDWVMGTYLSEGTKLFYLKFCRTSAIVHTTGWKEALGVVLRLGLPRTGAHSTEMSIFCSHYYTERCSAYSSQGEILQSLLMPNKHWTLLEAGPPKSQPLLKTLLPMFYSFTCFSYFLLSVFSFLVCSGKQELFLSTESVFLGTFLGSLLPVKQFIQKALRSKPRPQHIPRCLGTCTRLGLTSGNFYIFQHENKAVLLTEISGTADSISWGVVK